MTIPNINQFPACNAERRAWLASLKSGDEVLWIRSDGPLVVKVLVRSDDHIVIDSPDIPRGASKKFTPKTGMGKAGQYSTDGYILPLNKEIRLEAIRMRHLKAVRADLGRVFWQSVPDDMVEKIEAILGDKLKAHPQT